MHAQVNDVIHTPTNLFLHLRAPLMLFSTSMIHIRLISAKRTHHASSKLFPF
jgi:hypothetical protein